MWYNKSARLSNTETSLVLADKSCLHLGEMLAVFFYLLSSFFSIVQSFFDILNTVHSLMTNHNLTFINNQKKKKTRSLIDQLPIVK